MHIAGIALLFIIFYVFYTYKSEADRLAYMLALASFFELFVNVGYFIMIGRYELKYHEFIMLILTCYLVFIIHRQKFDIDLILLFSIFGIFIVVNNALLIFNPYENPTVIYGGSTTWDSHYLYGAALEYVRFTKQTLLMDARYALFIFMGLFYKQYNSRLAIDKFLFFGRMILVLVCVELLSGNIGYGEIFSLSKGILFGIGQSTAAFTYRGGVPILSGLTLEPGHLARGLWIWMLVYIMSSDVPKYRVIAFAMIVALLSGSFASVLYVGSAIAVLLVKRFNIRLLLIYIAGTLLGGVLLVVIAPELFTHNYTRLLNVIGILSENSNGKVTLGSEGIRLLSMAEAIRAFLTRPFCGIGIGSAYVYSGILSLLQTIGLIGTSILFIYYGKIIGGVKSPTVALILCAMLAPCCFTGGIDVFYSCYFLLMLLTVRTYGQNKIFVRQGEDI